MIDATVTSTLVTAVVTGLVSSLGTIAALKVEIKWLHHKADTAHARIDHHDREITDIVRSITR